MISAVVLTKDEEKNINDCLESLKWCDGVAVVDDESKDKTLEIARRMGARVFTRPLEGNYAAQRNFGLEKANGDWILFVDADERVSKVLAGEILLATKNPNLTGYFVKRKDFMFGRWLDYGETAQVKLMRLARKGAGLWERPIHETWRISGRTGELNTRLLHYPHPTVADFLKKINLYTTLDAQEFYRQGAWIGVETVILYPIAKFVLNYFLRLGFLDGMAGLLVALMMSFHSFLTRGKLWQLKYGQGGK